MHVPLIVYYTSKKEEIKEKLNALGFEDQYLFVNEKERVIYSTHYFMTYQTLFATQFHVTNNVPSLKEFKMEEEDTKNEQILWEHEFQFQNCLVPLPWHFKYVPCFERNLILQTRFSWPPCTQCVQFLIQKTFPSYVGLTYSLSVHCQFLYVHLKTGTTIIGTERFCEHDNMLLVKITSYKSRGRFETSFVCFICGIKNLRYKKIDATLCRLVGLKK